MGAVNVFHDPAAALGWEHNRIFGCSVEVIHEGLDLETLKANFPRWEHIKFEYGRWTATHENYDCDYNDEDGFVGNGWLAEGRTLEDLADDMEFIEAEKSA